MNLNSLSNQELVASLLSLRSTERESTLAILYHLIELEDRGLYREAGYSSIYDYALRVLGYAGGSAYRRIEGARCLREHPELGDLFLNGEVTLCTITTAAKSIRNKTVAVQEIVGLSKREVEKLVAPVLPNKPKETVRPLIVEPTKAPLVPDLPKEERFELRFSVSTRVYQELQTARMELSTSLGRDLSLEAVFSKLLELRKKRQQRRRYKMARTDTRHIPEPVKEEVRQRDGNQCTYVAPDGTRCTARNYLEFDHVTPFSLGGKSEARNIRLRCKVHNSLAAEHVFGKGFIARCIRNRRIKTATKAKTPSVVAAAA